MRPASSVPRGATRLLLGLLAVIATACSGGGSPATITGAAPVGDGGANPASSGARLATAGTVDPDAARSAAEVNIDLLQGSDDVRLIEVLNVADGTIATLEDAVWGDRPVLLWFWAPH